MRTDTTNVVTEMARREAAASLLTPPRVEWGAEGPSVRVRLVTCPACGARPHERGWAPPFRDGTPPGPVLRMLACETITARGLLPIIAAPGLWNEEFKTRGLTWLEVAHLDLAEALATVDAAERWVTDPRGARGRTLPASTRRRDTGEAWPEHRGRLVPSFLSPHPAAPSPLERLYAREREEAVVRGYAVPDR